MNIDQFLMPTDLFVRRSALWMEMVSLTRATILCSPNFGYKHYLKRFKPEEQTELDLSCVRLIFNGAEPISADLCREFTTTMSKFGLDPKAMYTVFGLAEACLAVSFPKVGSDLSTIHVQRDSLIAGQSANLTSEPTDQSIELVRCGFPLVDIEVMIADEANQSLPENAVGRVLIRGENVTKGYYHAEALNAQVISADGWLDTGDQGLFNESQLVITGRTKDLVIVNGQNYYAPDLESICELVEGIELGKVAVCGVRNPVDAVDELVVFVLHRGDIEALYPITIDVRRQLIEKAGLDVSQVVPIKIMPKTTSGKVQRFALSEKLLSGEFEQEIKALKEVYKRHSESGESTAAGSPIENMLLTICNNVISDQHIGIDDNLFDMGASSLKLAQIHEQIDEYFPDLLDLTDFFDHPTIAELATFLESKTGASEPVHS
jgi:acyl-CoA synthetase (AMP-forming)/AMP-acid ligase II